MIYAYSQNVTVNQNERVSFNNVALKKGCTCLLSSPKSLILPRKGLYQVTVCANGSVPSATTDASQTLSLQISDVTSAKASMTVTDTSTHNLCVSSVINVPTDAKCCNAPVEVYVTNTGATATYTDISIIITKIG